MEEGGFLKFCKKLKDKGNRYIEVTGKGEERLDKVVEDYEGGRSGIVKGAQALHEI